MTVLIVTVIIVTVIIVTVIIETVIKLTIIIVTVIIVTVVIVTYFRKKQLDALTTDEMFEGQRFAILAMFICTPAPVS